MRVNKLDWENSRTNNKALTSRSSPSEELAHRTLFRITPLQLPGWTVYFHSSHSKKKSIYWLMSKGFQERLNKTELEILLISSLDAPAWLLNLVDFLYENNHQIATKRFVYKKGIEFFKLVNINLSKRFFRSFRPELSIFKVWTRKKVIPPSPYVGVGYSDYGTMGSGLAWQDQMISDSESLDLFELSSQLCSLTPKGSTSNRSTSPWEKLSLI